MVKKRQIAFVHPAPLGNVHFASGEMGAAGYVQDRERRRARVRQCKGDSSLLGKRYAEFQVYVTRRLEKVETQPN